MPVSFFDPVPVVFNIIDFYRPKSILDIGIGFGKYGVLCRELLDIFHGRFNKEQWDITIDGIEVFEKYRNRLWDVYNNIYIGDAINILNKSNSKYDLIICSDVIEHFDKESGHKLINLCLKKSDKIIINTPREFMEQGDVFGNIYETHRSLWKPRDFRRYHGIVHKSSDTIMTVIILRDYKFRRRLNIMSIMNNDKLIGKMLKSFKKLYYKSEFKNISYSFCLLTIL